MTDKELNSAYTRICSSLADGRLKPSFDLLRKLITENGLVIHQDECNSLEEIYRTMLKYTVEGVSDPGRRNVYHKLIVSVFELSDRINEALRMKYSSSLEYRKKRASGMSKATVSPPFQEDPGDIFLHQRESSQVKRENAPGNEKQNLSQKDQTEVQGKEILTKIHGFFYRTWFVDRISSEEILGMNRFMQNQAVPVHYKSFLVSAIILSQQRFFDPAKFSMLFDYYNSGDPAISQRALIGLLINLYKYDSRLEYYPEINGRVKILIENPDFRRDIETIIKQFIRSKGTEKLQKRIHEDILPEMIRISSNLKNKIKLDSLMEEGLSEDRNPDWEDILKDSPGLFHKMEEFTEMQIKGDDVFMGSFSMLKSFPFFDNPSNWFMPFFKGNPEISSLISPDELSIWQLVDVVEHAPVLCNSDKYSFCLSIQKLPAENLTMFTQVLKAEMEQVKELSGEEDLLNPGRKPEFLSNQYIQDLYRFYKLFPGKTDFDDLFEWRLDFHNKKVLSDLFKEDIKMLRNIAEYYIAGEYFEEAAGILTGLPEEEKSEELYQKIAWCFQKTGDFNTALEFYLKAEMAGTTNTWTLKKIALCYRNLRKPDKALEYYQAAEKSDPESLDIQINKGHCLLELNRYEEALKCYFKVEYLAPGNKKVWRPLGWCSFITGKKEQAEKYFMKLMDEEPSKHDFISMGHVKWCLGKRREAIEYYRKSLSGKGFSETEFLEIFEEDRPQLLNQGIDKDDIPIMLDQLRYFMGA